jgi:hypothetical protein
VANSKTEKKWYHYTPHRHPAHKIRELGRVNFVHLGMFASFTRKMHTGWHHMNDKMTFINLLWAINDWQSGILNWNSKLQIGASLQRFPTSLSSW